MEGELYSVEFIERTSNKATPVRIIGSYDSIRTKIDEDEVYHGVQITRQYTEREREAATAVFRSRTCYNCALRQFCSGYDETRTAPCAGKVLPLPPLTQTEMKKRWKRAKERQAAKRG